jgi:hypothetical protein
MAAMIGLGTAGNQEYCFWKLVRIDDRALAGAITGLDRRQEVHVGAGAEALTRARQDDDAYAVVFAGGAHGGANVAVHLAAPGIEFVGAIERDDSHASLGAIKNVFIGFHSGVGHHRLPSVSLLKASLC